MICNLFYDLKFIYGLQSLYCDVQSLSCFYISFRCLGGGRTIFAKESILGQVEITTINIYFKVYS